LIATGDFLVIILSAGRNRIMPVTDRRGVIQAATVRAVLFPLAVHVAVDGDVEQVGQSMSGIPISSNSCFVLRAGNMMLTLPAPYRIVCFTGLFNTNATENQ